MIVVIGIPDGPAFGIGKMLLVEPYESVDERTRGRWRLGGQPVLTITGSCGAQVDLLQVPVVYMIVVIGIPHDPDFGEIGKMLLVKPYESIDKRRPDPLTAR